MTSAGVAPQSEHGGLVRVATCGSVDDGKSTLIGRMLYDAQVVAADQLATLVQDSARAGAPDGLDFALLLDGLVAEREQKITIDVAHRYFSTARRSFILADAPGHEQYTRNMVTAASTADVAVLVVDARRGPSPQSRRHLWIVGSLGIEHLVVAVTKMDLVGWSEGAFARVADACRELADRAGARVSAGIPVAGTTGDNVARRSPHSPWYVGPTLLEHLDRVSVDSVHQRRRPFRMPVQWVNRADASFRGFAGLVSSGVVRVGDRVQAARSRRACRITRIIRGPHDEPSSAAAGEPVTLVLDEEIDVSRGDVLSCASAPVACADRFVATVVWMDDEAAAPGRVYAMKIGTNVTVARISAILHRIDTDSFGQIDAPRLALNEVGLCEVATGSPVPFEQYDESRALGAFILIDRVSNATVGAGMIRHAAARSPQWQPTDVDQAARAAQKGQVAKVVWFTGIPAAGKSTIANLVERQLYAHGRHTYTLDGDNLRHALCSDLGFSAEDRDENVRRVAEVARLMADAGLIVLVTLVSPFRAARARARALIGVEQFVEVFVDTPVAVAETRDPKGLYARARAGTLGNFTGVSSPYEAPESPELTVDTTRTPPQAAADAIVALLL